MSLFESLSNQVAANPDQSMEMLRRSSLSADLSGSSCFRDSSVIVDSCGTPAFLWPALAGVMMSKSKPGATLRCTLLSHSSYFCIALFFSSRSNFSFLNFWRSAPRLDVFFVYCHFRRYYACRKVRDQLGIICVEGDGFRWLERRILNERHLL